MHARISVVKIGGSLAADAPRLRAILARLADGSEGPSVIVPGGGPFADAVRTAQAALGFADPLAHRLALDAMGHMAEVFCALETRLAIARSVEEASEAMAQRRVVVWKPSDLRAGHPEIAESWEVTSDSLALWLARLLAAARCTLIKSARCPVGAGPDELARRGIVDAAFPEFARGFAGEIVVLGAQTEDDLFESAGCGFNPNSHLQVPRKGPEGGRQDPLGKLECSLETLQRLALHEERESRISRPDHQLSSEDATA